MDLEARKSPKLEARKSSFVICKLFNKNNILIGFVDKRRANFYLRKNLAEVINKEPLEIRLLFEANGPGVSYDPFNIQGMQDVCVACGITKTLSLHHVVPNCYRIPILDRLKQLAPRYIHDMHDILPICVKCHGSYENHSSKLKEEIAKRYSISREGIWFEPFTNRTIKYAKTLIKHGHLIPQDKKNILLKEVQKVTGKIPIEYIQLDDLKEKAKNHYKYHGVAVVEQLKNYAEIEQFVIKWRTHFVDYTSPKFLPQFWDINRSLKTLDIRDVL